MTEPGDETSGPAWARDVDWDELDEIAVIGIDSEGARRVYTNTDDPKTWLWLARHLSLHVDEAIRGEQRDVFDGTKFAGGGSSL